jgi:acetyltransferase-like isoleucine patch superfamily enzyme
MSNDNIKSGILGKSPISVGRFTYGFDNISIKQWNEGASLNIGAFCSIAMNTTIFLGGNHRTDWITTFPFGHIFQDELGG